MRSATSFTLHAILAACLAAFAASGAAAAPPTGGKEEVYFTITLTDARATDSPYLGRNDGRLQSFEIKEWSFDKVSKVDSFTVKQGVKPGGTADVTMKRGTGPSTAAAPGGVAVASGDVNDSASTGVGVSESVTVGSGQTESAQATGKRQHMPLRIRQYYDQAPPPSGSFRVKVRYPWPDCRVGTRYPSLALNAGGKSYLLQDVQIADCGGTEGSPVEEVGFVYGKVTVRGWDPEKKEQ